MDTCNRGGKQAVRKTGKRISLVFIRLAHIATARRPIPTALVKSRMLCFLVLEGLVSGQPNQGIVGPHY